MILSTTSRALPTNHPPRNRYKIRDTGQKKRLPKNSVQVYYRPFTMMKRLITLSKIAAVAVGCWASLSSQAQSPPTITFHEAVSKALQENVTLKTEQNNLIINQAQKMAAIGAFTPQ